MNLSSQINISSNMCIYYYHKKPTLEFLNIVIYQNKTIDSTKEQQEHSTLYLVQVAKYYSQTMILHQTLIWSLFQLCITMVFASLERIYPAVNSPWNGMELNTTYKVRKNILKIYKNINLRYLCYYMYVLIFFAEQFQ